MKNLKIANKLIVSFGIVILLFCIVVATSIISILSSKKEFTSFFNDGYNVCTQVLTTRGSIQSSLKNIGYAIMSPDVAQTKTYVDAARADLVSVDEGIAYMEKNFKGDTTLVASLKSDMEKAKVVQEQVYALTLEMKNDQASTIYFAQAMPILVTAQEHLAKIYTEAETTAVSGYDGTIQFSNVTLWVVSGLSLMALLITLIVATYLTKSIKYPLLEIERATEMIAQGNLNVSVTYHSRDELGNLSNRIRELSDTLKAIISDEAYLLGEMGGGNFNVQTREEAKYVGDFQALLLSMRKINTNLSETLTQINHAADQVASGSDQVSSGAQALSQGATEQASSVEELAATINEISQNVKGNAENAFAANALVAETGAEVGTCNAQMQQMVGAMQKISQSSNEIGKIIKTIEDIAFQTNILALNAAVEAARAGAAGKGFAVVADEVRNLASKSAEAAKSTTALIEHSLKSVEEGANIADATLKSLLNVVEGSSKIAMNMEKITGASNEQANAVAQVTLGIDQISAVVQTNSATSEESAAASEELSSQAQMLKGLVGRFRLKDDSVSNSMPSVAQTYHEPARLPEMGAMGKY